MFKQVRKPNTYPATETINDQVYLESLVAPTFAPTPTSETERTVAHPRPQRKPKPLDTNSLEYRIGRGLAAIASILFAGALWYAGAYFTLVTARAAIPSINSLSYLAYLLPLAISVIEIYQWPTRNHVGWFGRSIWAVVSLVDIGTSCAGIVRWASGQTFDIFTTFTLPKESPILYGLGFVLGVIFAFVPERIVREMSNNIRGVI